MKALTFVAAVVVACATTSAKRVRISSGYGGAYASYGNYGNYGSLGAPSAVARSRQDDVRAIGYAAAYGNYAGYSYSGTAPPDIAVNKVGEEPQVLQMPQERWLLEVADVAGVAGVAPGGGVVAPGYSAGYSGYGGGRTAGYFGSPDPPRPSGDASSFGFGYASGWW